MLKLESKIAVAEIVHTGPDLIFTYAQLRVDCQRIGHPLSQRAHDAERARRRRSSLTDYRSSA
ncbi:MAG: hypothetical protein ACYDDZ_08600 [Acidimicrobiales bacterium]